MYEIMYMLLQKVYINYRKQVKKSNKENGL